MKNTFWARGVSILGGIRVLDGEKLLQVVSEGGSGYCFEDFAGKVCIVRERGVGENSFDRDRSKGKSMLGERQEEFSRPGECPHPHRPCLC
jgi:hypothetical protein